MYVYNYRIFDLYKQTVVSLAILADDSPNWRPNRYVSGLWSCELSLTFPIVKLLDYGADIASLAEHENPIVLILLAHLQSRTTREDHEARCTAKVDLVKSLIDRGFNEERVRQLFRIIDWLLELSPELTHQFKDEVHAYQQEKNVPYISSLERLAKEEGKHEGKLEQLLEVIATGLSKKFPNDADELLGSIKLITDSQQLLSIHEAFWSGESIDTLRNLIDKP